METGGLVHGLATRYLGSHTAVYPFARLIVESLHLRLVSFALV